MKPKAEKNDTAWRKEKQSMNTKNRAKNTTKNEIKISELTQLSN